MHIEIMTGMSFFLSEKCSLLEVYDKTSQGDATAKLGVPQVTLCSLLKQQETVMTASDGDGKRRHMGKATVVEAAFIKWIDNAQSCNAPIEQALSVNSQYKQSLKFSNSVSLLYIHIINIQISVRW